MSTKVTRELKIVPILKTTFKNLKKTILPSLLWFLIFIMISVFVKQLILNLTHATWNLNIWEVEYEQISEKLQNNPDYELSPEEQQINQLFPVYNTLVMILNWLFIFVPLFGTQLVSARKFFGLIGDEDFPDNSWKDSITFPLSNGKNILFSVLILIVGTSLTAAGVLIVFPAFLFITYIMFLIMTFTIDEKDMKETFQGTQYYIRGILWKTFFLISINLIIPFLFSFILQPIIMNALGFTLEQYVSWLDPENYQFFSVLAYDFMTLFLQVIFFLLVPTVVTATFTQRRQNLLEYREKTLKQAKLQLERPKIIKIEVSFNSKYYLCQVCRAEIPISSKKCSKCGQLYYTKFKK